MVNVPISNQKQEGWKAVLWSSKIKGGIAAKLEKLKNEPRRELDAHKLKGKLEGKWSCSLGYDIRMVYEIDDQNKEIVVVAVGSHKKAYD